MIHKIKTLGLAFVAVLAMTAVAASAAQAGEFTSGSEATIIEGEATNAQVFTGTEPLEVSCETATFFGEAEGTSSEDLEITPEYSNCEALGGFPATVDFTSCYYRFTADGTPHSTVHVECANPGDTIDITAWVDPNHTELLCEIEVEEGTYTGVSYTNDSGNMVTVDATVQGISYIETGVFCPDPDVTQNNGTYTGSATVFGFDALTLEPTPISVHVP